MLGFYNPHYDYKENKEIIDNDSNKEYNDNNEGNSHQNENKNNKDNNNSSNNYTLIIIFIILGVIFVALLMFISFYIGMKIKEKRKIRANELKEDIYDYSPESESTENKNLIN